MGLDRRTFLQQAGLALFTLGAAETGISSLGGKNLLTPAIQNYFQTLAQTTNRKLALLVGINQYPQNPRLSGCLTDVELQKELLVARFGFNPKDILILSDRQATRENIETAFVEHLSEQAQADDVVVFHFSGYGGQVKMPLAIDDQTAEVVAEPDTYQLVNSLMPVDGILTTKGTPAANDLLQDTLLLMAQSLPTNKFTIVLDTSFNKTSQSRRGNLKIRSLNQIAEKLAPQEVAFREQLLLKLSAQKLKPTKRLLSIPGVVLSAAGKNQVAAEGHWNGFSAGLFTYALTQYLWQIAPTNKLRLVLQRTAETVEQIMGRQQQPTISSTEKPSIAYYMTASDSPNAVGVVEGIAKNGIVSLKLIGLPAKILDCYGIDSCLGLINGDNNSENIKLQIKSRDGFNATAQILDQKNIPDDSSLLKQLATEVIRVLDRDLHLTMALDADLQRIEKVDATSALANIEAINSVVAVGEQSADCLLGKVKSSNKAEAKTSNSPSTSESEPSISHYGLFSAGGVLISRTTGVGQETIKSAISRLEPQFNNLLAAKWLELTNNEFSSTLNVAATLQLVTKNDADSLRRATQASSTSNSESTNTSFFPVETNSSVPILVKGSQIRLVLTNSDELPLYAILIGIDSDSNVFALYTPEKSTSPESKAQLKDIAIAPQTALTVPETEEAWKWKVSDALGITTIYAIFSTAPFRQTLCVLADRQNLKLDREQVLNILNPVAVARAIMQDLHSASSVSDKIVDSNKDVYALDVDRWATLNFVCEVVNG